MHSIGSAAKKPIQTPPGEAGGSVAQTSGKREVSLPLYDRHAALHGLREPVPLESLPMPIFQRIVGLHRANPDVHYCNHQIELNVDRSVELVDFNEQGINIEARGQWALGKTINSEKYILSVVNPVDVREQGGEEYHNFKVAFEIVNEEKTILAQPKGRRRRGEPIDTLTFSSKLVFDQDPLKLLCIGDKAGPVTRLGMRQEGSNFPDNEREYWAMDNAAKKTLDMVLLLRQTPL